MWRDVLCPLCPIILIMTGLEPLKIGNTERAGDGMWFKNRLRLASELGMTIFFFFDLVLPIKSDLFNLKV